jgi:hydrogenase maturation protein HypF
MVGTLDHASALAVLDEVSVRALVSIERPIVLVAKGANCAIAPSVAPRNRMIGIMLPYTPLHHLLLAAVARPLVMTSGNLSDEPIAVANDDALARLGTIADLFVLHDRDIASRADDSVVSVIAGSQTVLRRSRGYVPRAVTVGAGFARPTLACGAQLKNTFCIAAGTNAWLGPHIGDLEHVAACDSYVDAIRRMEHFLQIAPEVIAYDMHPDYESTRYARARPEMTKIAVQHHHAHVVSAMAEHGVAGPVIGLAYDGAGFGTDGTIWGGEILLAERHRFRRLATFRPVSLIGGDHAVRAPWRIALALLDDAYAGSVPDAIGELLPRVIAGQVDAVTTLLRGSAFPRARGVGRYFDAFGALFLGRTAASFEGQIALEWNQIADPRVARLYGYDLDTESGLCEIDLRETLRQAVADRIAGVDVGAIAAAFHNTIARATAEVVRAAIDELGALPIVASGGCFQNALLADRVREALAPDYDVLFHRTVPPGDGGIALGQAVVADARVKCASRKSEVESLKSEVRSRKSEVRGQKYEVGTEAVTCV